MLAACREAGRLRRRKAASRIAVETGPEPVAPAGGDSSAACGPGHGRQLRPREPWSWSPRRTRSRVCMPPAAAIVHTHAKDGRCNFYAGPEEVYGIFAEGGIEALNTVSTYFTETARWARARCAGTSICTPWRRSAYDGYLTIEREVGRDAAADIRAGCAFSEKKVGKTVNSTPRAFSPRGIKLKKTINTSRRTYKMMKLGLVSAILPDQTFEEVIDYAAQAGFACVEVCCWPEGQGPAPLRRRHPHRPQRPHRREDDATIVDYAAIQGRRASAPSPTIPNPLDGDEEAAEASPWTTSWRSSTSPPRWASTWSPPSSARTRPKSVEENLEKYVQGLDARSSVTPRRRACRIGIENCPMYYTKDEWPGGNNLASTPYIWQKMFELIPEQEPGPQLRPQPSLSAGRLLHKARVRVCRPHLPRPLQGYHRSIRTRWTNTGASRTRRSGTPRSCPAWAAWTSRAFCSALNDIRYTGPACIEVEDRAYEGCIEDVKSRH